MPNIIVVAGTADARQVVEELSRLDVQVVATVTTSLGGHLLKQYEKVEVREGKLASEDMAKLIREKQAPCLVDASHPFAREASLNAIRACNEAGIVYLRFEREETEVGTCEVIRVKDYEEAVKALEGFDGNIFLTTGSNRLEAFVNMGGFPERVFARVLPDSKVLAKCEALGLNARNILAMKGPFSEAMNIEMLKYCNASVLLTKDSGSTGGNDEKINAAGKLGIPVVMIERPEVEYGKKVGTVKEVVEFVKYILEGLK